MSLINCSICKVSLRAATWPLAALVAAALAGCESNPLSGAKVYPVTGKVLLPDGKPLTAARIVFVDTKSAVTIPASLESDGSFTVKGTLGDGLPEGDYKVRIEIDEAKLPQIKGAPGKHKTALPFAESYTDEDSSGLTASIKAGDNPPLEFKLTNQGNAPGKQSKHPRD